MKLSRIASLLAVGFLATVVGHNAALWIGDAGRQRWELVPSEIDLGPIPIGQVVQRSFVLHNLGNARLLVTDVESSCQCIVAELPSRVIEPGTSIVFNISFYAKSLGKKSQRVVVRTDNRSRPIGVVKLQAQVVQNRSVAIR